jgi:uncharacterized protein YndB with AHSA1/START domain
MEDRVEKRIVLEAAVSRVWRALTDFREFGEWFRVNSKAPFEVGKAARGRIAYPGYEHLTWEATIKSMEPERLFSFTWHPYAVDLNVDYSKEEPTLIEFRLEPTKNRHFACLERIRLWQDSEGTAHDGAAKERRGLGSANDEYRCSCCVTAEAQPRRAPPTREHSPRWTRREGFG